jgi:ArsR family transcriptional regulator
MISPTYVPLSPIAPTQEPQLDDATAAILQLGKLLSDETRVRILTLLCNNEELCVRSLWETLGQTQPGVSHHLALLREGGLVKSHQVGRNIYYRIDRQRLGQLVAEIAATPLGGQITGDLRQ